MEVEIEDIDFRINEIKKRLSSVYDRDKKLYFLNHEGIQSILQILLEREMSGLIHLTMTHLKNQFYFNFIFSDEDITFLLKILYYRLDHVKIHEKNFDDLYKGLILIPILCNVFPHISKNSFIKYILNNQDNIKEDQFLYLNLNSKEVFYYHNYGEKKELNDIALKKIYSNCPDFYDFLNFNEEKEEYLGKLQNPLNFSDSIQRIQNDIEYFELAITNADNHKVFTEINENDYVNKTIILKGNHIHDIINNPGNYEKYKKEKKNIEEIKGKIKLLLEKGNKVFSLKLQSKNASAKIDKLDGLHKKDEIYHNIKGYDDLFLLEQLDHEKVKKIHTTDQRIIYDSLYSEINTLSLIKNNVYELSIYEIFLEGEELKTNKIFYHFYKFNKQYPQELGNFLKLDKINKINTYYYYYYYYGRDYKLEVIPIPIELIKEKQRDPRFSITYNKTKNEFELIGPPSGAAGESIPKRRRTGYRNKYLKYKIKYLKLKDLLKNN